MAPALPQVQVAFAAWHLFLEGGCQQRCKPGDHPLCPLGPLHEACLLPEGLAWAVLGEGVREGLVLSSQSPLPRPPGESQESQDQHPQICVLGPCWGMGQGETRERMKDVEGVGQEVKRPAFVSKGQQAS